ncbi:hypothetical protein [Prosthecobacter sp.]|uniref:hypothetical protein n=1 Tax=Prosthecobacter sp. TaxID=1965333 RepID=UPI003783B6FF
MKGVVDIFISKEKLAFFWFVAACACLGVTGWYTYDVAVTSRGSMLYVPIEKSFVYLDRSMQQEELDEVVDYHARLSLETLLNRGSNGPTTPERLSRLFAGAGMDQAVKDVQESRYDFHIRKIHQVLVLGQIRVQHFPTGEAETLAQGQLVRVSIDPASNEAITQSFVVTARQSWGRNQNLRDSRRFPFVCTNIEYSIRPLSSSE